IGWNRPDVSMNNMTNELKHIPDYYTANGYFVEVGGLGRDGIYKLKLDKYEGLAFWNKMQPLKLFVWNSSTSEWALIQWSEVKRLVAKARKVGVQEFEVDIAMEPENWALVDDEVEALVAEGQLREAIERLHTLIEQQEPFADLHVRLADLYSQSSDDEATLHHYQIALDLQPNYLEAKVKLGAHHLLNGRWDEAAETFHNACELNDRVLVNYIGIGVAQAAAGRTAEAMNSFDLAATVEPNSTLLLTEMARLQLKASLADEFIKNFEPSHASAATEIELDNDDLLHKQVERHGQEIASNPNHADLRYRYGVLLRSEGRLAEALEQFSAATEINPNYTQAIIKLGITQQELGQVEEAVQTFIKALDLAPAYVDLHYRLGLLHTNKREFEEAIKHMESASEGAPDNKQIRAALALSLQNMGLMDKAAATWRSLWKLHHAETS
ncbi:hypothetical protein LCGC14_2457280, partial [marine sediment metagenome]